MKSLLNHLSSIYIYLPLSLMYTQRDRQETATLNLLTGAHFQEETKTWRL